MQEFLEYKTLRPYLALGCIEMMCEYILENE